METLAELFPEQPGGRRRGQPVRRYTKVAQGAEGRFWRPFRRGQAARYMLAAERFDQVGRVAHRAQKTRRHNGPLGHVALDVLRYLLRVIDYRSGRLDPAILTIAAKIGRSPAAVVDALKRLRMHGFLNWLRRYVATGHEGRGPQVRQTSNAYCLHLPACAERLLSPPAPTPDDHALRQLQAARDAQEMALSNPSTPLEAAIARLGRGVNERDSKARSESPTNRFIDMRNGLPAMS